MNLMPVTAAMLDEWTKEYDKSTEYRLASMALSKTELKDAAWVGSGAAKMRHKFSVEVKTLPVTNQKNSGRCWLFAAANILRERIAQANNLEDFELSQSWLAFWDKFERANYFIECILKTADLPTNDRTVMFLLQTGVHDGGQWDMFANIVRKYGIVPKDVYDETAQTGATRSLNYVLNRAMKAAAVKLRRMVAEAASEEEMIDFRNQVMKKVYGFLCTCYGRPPESFDFEMVDKDGNYRVVTNYTPASFRDEYVGDLLEQMVSCINAPTSDKPFHRTYTIKMLGNVVEGRQVKHLNLTMAEMKAAIIAQLKAGKPVWFGSDVGHYGERDLGIWDDGCFDFETLTGLDLDICKTDALNYSFAAMNHAMVLTGVNLDENGQPNRWKIENSWGDEHGKKGYYVCSDTWFDQYVFQAAIEKEYLGELASFAETEPMTLDPWDPMGTLAD